MVKRLYFLPSNKSRVAQVKFSSCSSHSYYKYEKNQFLRMKKESEYSASGLIIESGMENDTISAKDHRKVCFSEGFVNDPLKNLAV